MYNFFNIYIFFIFNKHMDYIKKDVLRKLCFSIFGNKLNQM